MLSARWEIPIDTKPISIPFFYFAALAIFFLSFILPKPIVKFIRRTTEIKKNELSVCMIHWALLETIAIIGLTTTLQTQLVTTFYPFFGLSILGFIITFPRDDVVTSKSISD